MDEVTRLAPPDDMARNARGQQSGFTNLAGVAAGLGVLAARSWLVRERDRLETGEATGSRYSVLVGASAVAAGAALVRRWAGNRKRLRDRRAALAAADAASASPGVALAACQCRICREDAPRSRLVVPCDCRGSLVRAPPRKTQPALPYTRRTLTNFSGLPGVRPRRVRAAVAAGRRHQRVLDLWCFRRPSPELDEGALAPLNPATLNTPGIIHAQAQEPTPRPDRFRRASLPSNHRSASPPL